jgi:hypothetical protein
MGTACCEIHTNALGFSRADWSAPDSARPALLYGSQCPYLRTSQFQGLCSLQRKENSSRNSSRRLRVCLRCRSGRLNVDLHKAGSGMLTRFPFALRVNQFNNEVSSQHMLGTELPVRLGPPDPCSTAVHMEPFSTSVFKVLT